MLFFPRDVKIIVCVSAQVVKEVSPQTAWEILRENPGAVLIDVRSTMEYDYVGHPLDAVNIPWKESPAWHVNPDFAGMVREMLLSRQEINTEIESSLLLLICRSGKRSYEAGEELARHGFKNVYNVTEGFEGDRDGDNHRSTISGWRFRNLPWEQS